MRRTIDHAMQDLANGHNIADIAFVPYIKNPVSGQIEGFVFTTPRGRYLVPITVLETHCECLPPQ